MISTDAKRAIGFCCAGIVRSNHGSYQLNAPRIAFDQFTEIVDAVGNDIDV